MEESTLIVLWGWTSLMTQLKYSHPQNLFAVILNNFVINSYKKIIDHIYKITRTQWGLFEFDINP